MIYRIWFSLWATLTFSVVLAQPGPPVIEPGGIRNAATLAGPGEPGYNALTLNMMTVIRGLNLAEEEIEAPGFDPVVALGGTRVYVDGRPGWIYRVSPTEVLFATPSYDVPLEKRTAVVEIETRYGRAASEVRFLRQPGSNLGIFTQQGSRCGTALAFNAEPGFQYSWHDPVNSISPGGILKLHTTGSGTNMIVNGRLIPVALRGALWIGRVPGRPGIYEWDVELPEDLPEGCNSWVVLSDNTQLSQRAALHIKRNGGQCEPNPGTSLGWAEWKRVESTIEPPRETFRIRLTRSIGNRFPGEFYAASQNQFDLVLNEGPRCDGVGETVSMVGKSPCGCRMAIPSYWSARPTRAVSSTSLKRTQPCLGQARERLTFKAGRTSRPSQANSIYHLHCGFSLNLRPER